MSIKYAATLCPLSKKSMAHRVVWQRISYDKGWHGGNQAKATHPDATPEQAYSVAKCPFCSEYDSLDHIFRYCQYSDLPALRTAVFSELSAAISNTLSDKRCTQLNYDLAAAMRDMAATPLPQPTHTVGLHDGWRIWTGQWTLAHRKDLASRIAIHLPLSDLAKTSLRRTGKHICTIIAKGAWTLWARRCQLASKQQNSSARQLRIDHSTLRFDKITKNKDKRHPIPEQRMTAHFPSVPALPKISARIARRIQFATNRTNRHLLNKTLDSDSSDSDDDWNQARRITPKTKRTSRWQTFSTFLSDSENDTHSPTTRKLSKQRSPAVAIAIPPRNTAPRVTHHDPPVICPFVHTQPLTEPGSDSLVRGRITS